MKQVNQILDRTKGDRQIWIIVLLLSLISLLAVYSATGSFDYREEKNSSFYLTKQIMVLGFGLCITSFIHRVNYTKFGKWAVVMYYASLPLLAYTLFFGKNVHDAARFITVPYVNLTFQSSDFAKLALFMFLARKLSIKKDVIQDFHKGFLPVLWPVLAVCGLIAPANLSTALMLGATCSIIFFIGRVQMKHLLLLAFVGMFGITMLFVGSLITGHGRAKTWIGRINDYVGKTEHGKPKEDPYQVQQAKIAIVNGGIIGRGPGKSIQKNFLPFPFSDFIYAIIIEEYGLVGGSLLILLYLWFLWRSILIFRRCPYAFGAFLAVGLSITLVFQAMLNMGVNVNLLPVTGLTLPMVSMGGSSIWFTSVAIGIILSVSKYVDEEDIVNNNKPKKVAAITDSDENNDATGIATQGESKLFIKTGKNRPLPGNMPTPTS